MIDHHSEEIGNFAMGFDGMPQRILGFHAVMILSTDSLTFKKTGLLQIQDHLLNGPLGDSHPRGYFA